MSTWAAHLAAGVQAAGDILLAAWTAANAAWSGRLERRRRRLAGREGGPR